MAWEDRSTFEAIFLQFGLNANDVVKFMRRLLSVKSFQRWRTRIAEQGQLKHSKNVNFSKNRFKCSRQRLDGTTKGWK